MAGRYVSLTLYTCVMRAFSCSPSFTPPLGETYCACRTSTCSNGLAGDRASAGLLCQPCQDSPMGSPLSALSHIPKHVQHCCSANKLSYASLIVAELFSTETRFASIFWYLMLYSCFVLPWYFFLSGLPLYNNLIVIIIISRLTVFFTIVIVTSMYKDGGGSLHSTLDKYFYNAEEIGEISHHLGCLPFFSV